jgi:hypothetical protein
MQQSMRLDVCLLLAPPNTYVFIPGHQNRSLVPVPSRKMMKIGLEALKDFRMQMTLMSNCDLRSIKMVAL